MTLQQHQADTVSTFGVRKSRCSASSRKTDSDGCESEEKGESEEKVSAKIFNYPYRIN